MESVSAKILGKDSDDYETKKDQEQLSEYKSILESRGFRAEYKLGFNHRAKEIVRIVKSENADLLVIGAHGHKGLQDIIHGQTVDSVRHELQIPVLVVHV